MEWVVSMLLRSAWLADAEPFANSAGSEVVVGDVMQADVALWVLDNWLLLLSLDILGG